MALTTVSSTFRVHGSYIIFRLWKSSLNPIKLILLCNFNTPLCQDRHRYPSLACHASFDTLHQRTHTLCQATIILQTWYGPGMIATVHCCRPTRRLLVLTRCGSLSRGAVKTWTPIAALLWAGGSCSRTNSQKRRYDVNCYHSCPALGSCLVVWCRPSGSKLVRKKQTASSWMMKRS